ncbi:hypothetical protein NHX12_011339 [Muraenolepis orangiensis]|uniref:Uncharacterized protein n=1 Tax=Muraenolepis orangiensis TaxID=630683 RepID=A0A9Q0I5L2_9TELE|nr:hypothetical protein NHX12_011339 [Muraenolepis orangiensis]
MEDYSNALRPVEDTDKALNVTLQITLSQIKDMDERNQVLIAYLWIRMTWNDAYLKWNKEDYDGLEVIRIPSSLVWRPDLVLYNKADEDFSGPMDTNVVLRYNGEITWDAPAITKSSCVVDVSYFPFDSQECNLTFGSWTYNGNQNVEWECHGMPATKNVIMYGCCSDPYPDITYTVLLQRRSSFYIFNLLLPCFLISFLAPLGFYLPADSGEKVSLGVTVLLALTVFQLMVAESMPPSESVPLIAKYYIATMTMITASTALTIFIMNIHFCSAEAKPVPRWAKVLIIDYMSKIFFVFEDDTPAHQNPASVHSQANSQVGAGRGGHAEQKPYRHPRPQTPMPQHLPRGGKTHHRTSAREEEPDRPPGFDEPRPKLCCPNDRKAPCCPEDQKSPCCPEDQKSPCCPEDQKAPCCPEDQKAPCCLEDQKAPCFLEDQKSPCFLEDQKAPCCPEDQKAPCCPEDQKAPLVDGPAVTFGPCMFCSHGDGIPGVNAKLLRNVEYIANCFREQRATCAKGAEWKKVAKVMDRFFMWIFFAMVFLMSILIMGRAPN